MTHDDRGLHVALPTAHEGRPPPVLAPHDDALGPLGAACSAVGLDPLARRLADLRSWLGDELIAVEEQIVMLGAGAGKHGDLAERAAAHLLGRPGKRLRPLCVVLGARMGGRGLDADVRGVALACELVHAATLLHDDVIDEGDERRGAATARVVYGNSASILAGDYLLIEALRRVQATGRPALVDTLLRTIGQMVAAEALQLERRGALQPDRRAYERIVDGKTAGLFRWALYAGGTLGDLPAAATAALEEAGLLLGRAFQLVDDLLDLQGDPAETGKSMLADLKQGKLTWPLLVAAESDPGLYDVLAGHHAGAGAIDTDALITRVRRAGGLDATRLLALRYAEQAREHLRTLPRGRARRALGVVIDAAVSRAA